MKRLYLRFLQAFIGFMFMCEMYLILAPSFDEYGLWETIGYAVIGGLLMCSIVVIEHYIQFPEDFR